MAGRVISYESLGGELHRHGDRLVHKHPHAGPHTHAPAATAQGDGHRHEGHGHSHGLVDESIKRSREGLVAVGLSLAVLGLTAGVQ
ncbi:MAG: hypothetical protein WBM00_06760, partial [Solirubrobacterales bacterium]